ncbi:hypothetical protein THRCLA_03019 [Thraustotheca clavata]|uniref:PPM-type phosphatase domain-containing protein n=1 Tax=Thraustotheca clavata TaxID=74557 RepID=A0A1W0A3F4_9STRA|nr:hypothetical protein THRCLA_03019 [Thraustotheca clavata]
MATATKIAGPSIDVHGVTDPGNPIKENQDTFFTIQFKDHVAMGVFDGHGKACGLLASSTARDFFHAKFSINDTYAELEAHPEQTMRKLFHECHLAIKEALRQRYLAARNNVQDRKGSFLVIKPTLLQKSILVQGGTTASIAIILHGIKLICANVGDSSALLSSATAKLQTSSWKSLQEIDMLRVHNNQGPTFSHPGDLDAEQVKPPLLVILSGDHSPEALVEFHSVAKSRPQTNHPHLPELMFLYDGIIPGSAKKLTLRERHQLLERRPVFQVQNNDIQPVGEGCYFKNVRQEWASLCCTPTKAKYHESLAFTRSLGDFYMHYYGITHEPDVIEVNLDKLNHGNDPPTFNLVLASDGIWDCWKYGEAAAFVLESLTHHDATSTAKLFMKKNKELSRGVFGSQVDNMTAIICSIRYHSEDNQ